MVDIAQALQASFDIVKRLRDVNNKVGEADFKMLLADLLSQLSDAKVDAADLKDQIVSLRRENEQLKDDLSRKNDAGPDVVDGTYVFADDGRHYCTGCYDLKGRKILLTEQPKDFQIFGKYSCPSCGKTFGTGAAGASLRAAKVV